MVFSCAFSETALCTLWQVMHDRLRASCALPCHSVCAPLVWHVRHVALTSRGDIAVKRLIPVLSPASTCAWPGPWQVSQLCPAFPEGVRSFWDLPCSVACRLLPSGSWQVVQVSSPT